MGEFNCRAGRSDSMEFRIEKQISLDFSRTEWPCMDVIFSIEYCLSKFPTYVAYWIRLGNEAGLVLYKMPHDFTSIPSM